MFELDNETNKIMRIFKTIEDKQSVADSLSKLTVKIGLEKKSSLLSHYYGEDEPDFIKVSCISFGLINLMEEDFYIIKEVLGYRIVFDFLKGKIKYLEIL
ncbi:hypothetical protein [Clostridium sp.]|uniref:hypothetical protein n=1 Tax=Clostridium sp. TaxID=1506 RepID=UPI001A63A0EA|nr:hypothetical protein [Clostridium sp.]MBK5237325.1 hypothetical protein [Clostridium sp.]